MSAIETRIQEKDPRGEKPYAPQMMVALLLYGFLLEKLGFILTTFGLLSFLLTMSDETKWPNIFTVAGAAAIGSFALFELWLKIRLPKGIFGF